MPPFRVTIESEGDAFAITSNYDAASDLEGRFVLFVGSLEACLAWVKAKAWRWQATARAA